MYVYNKKAREKKTDRDREKKNNKLSFFYIIPILKWINKINYGVFGSPLDEVEDDAEFRILFVLVCVAVTSKCIDASLAESTSLAVLSNEADKLVVCVLSTDTFESVCEGEGVSVGSFLM